MTSKEIADLACKVLSEKKGKDIISINISKQTTICDYFVICSGTSTTHVKALCDELCEKLKKIELMPKSKEGHSEGRWIALDYGDVVIHIFNDETRLFYHLERLWTNENNVERYPESN